MERNIVSFVKRKKACLHSEFSMSTTIERLLTWGGPLSMLAACAFAWLVRSGRSRCGSVGHVQEHTICVQLKVMETNDILSRWFQWIWNLFSCSWLPHFPLYKSYHGSKFALAPALIGEWLLLLHYICSVIEGVCQQHQQILNWFFANQVQWCIHIHWWYVGVQLGTAQTAALLCLKEFNRRRLYHHVPHIHDSSSELKLLLAKEIFGSIWI